MIKKLLNKFLIFVLFAGFAEIKTAIASSEAGADDILNFMSCETGYISDFIKYGSPQSCIDEPMLDTVNTAMITGGMSLTMVARLKMRNEDLFPGNCSRSQRADFYNPKITYGFCKNYKIVAALASYAFEAVTEWTAPTLDLKDITEIYKNTSPKLFVADMDVPAAYMYRISIIQDRICLSMYTLVGAPIPVGCKYIKEPYPRSVYSMQQENTATSGNDFTKCNSIYSCSERAKKESKTIAPIISPIISCIREMIIRLVVSNEVCNPVSITSQDKDIYKGLGSRINDGSTIKKFQINMQKAVTALLTIYIIFFGFRIALGAENIEKKDFINFVIKFILVAYFSVGINMSASEGGQRFDGMTSLIFPLLLNGVTEISSWMMTASNLNGLCYFPKSIYSGISDFNMSLWDQLDCRLAYYTGFDSLYDMASSRDYDPVDKSTPPYVHFIIPGLILGYPALIMIALSYPLLIVSLVAYALSSFVTSMILILVIGCLAPIFVPMALFKFTYGYFEKWWKNLLTLVLQPALAITFISVVFVVYDRSFYGTCVYRSVTVKQNIEGGTRNYRSFFISTDVNDYPSKEEMMMCKSSLGFFMNNPFNAIFGSLDSPGLSTFGEITGIIDLDQPPERIADIYAKADQRKFDGTNNPRIAWSDGFLIQKPKMFWEQLVNIVKNFIVCFIALIALKNLFAELSSFVMMMTGGTISASGAISSDQIKGLADSKAQALTQKAMQKREEIIGKIKGMK